MAESASAAATRELVASLPELQEALDDHVRDNDKLLAHVFFDGEVVPLAGEVARNRDEAAARRLGDALEQMAATGHADVLNVLEVSFVEAFEEGSEEDDAALAWLSRFFGPAMLACVERFRAYAVEMEAQGQPRVGFGERLESLRRSRLGRRKGRRAFERRARKLVGLRVAAVRYVGARNTTGYSRSPGIDTTDFGVELIGEEGRYVYIRWKFDDFDIVIAGRPMEAARTVWDVSADTQWRAFVGRTVTSVDIASKVADQPGVHVPLVPERLLDSLILMRRGVRLGKAAVWLAGKIGRERRNQYVPYGLTIHFGDRRVWLAAPREDDEGDSYSLSVVFDEDIARRLELVV